MGGRIGMAETADMAISRATEVTHKARRNYDSNHEFVIDYSNVQ